MPALDHEGERVDRLAQIVGPVHHGRQRGAGRHGDADRTDAVQPRTLHDRIGEVGRADHDRIHQHGIRRLAGDEVTDGVDDALHHIGSGRKLDGAEDGLAVDQDGVRIRAADIDANALHDANTDLNSRL